MNCHRWANLSELRVLDAGHVPGLRRESASRTAAAALAAFVLFWPAILCPILEIEKVGIRQQSSILGGIAGRCVV